MHWLNLAVVLLLLAGLIGLLVLTAADLLGLLRGPRWRMASPAAGSRKLDPAGPAPAAAPATPAEAPAAWIDYTRAGRAEHRQALPQEGPSYIGRQAFPGLPRDVAFRAVEVAWRDGMPAIRSLDPACEVELRTPETGESMALEAGSGWEQWPSEAELHLAGYALRWREAEEAP